MNENETIFVIEDEEDIRELISYNLKKNGYTVKWYESGEAFLSEAKDIGTGCIILDLMLPGIDGLEVCRQIKKDAKFNKLPIIMVTARGEEIDIVTGLEMGADDYIVKPFSPRILIARVRAMLRRVGRVEILSESSVEKFIVSEITIIPKRHEVFIDGNSLDFTASEFKALFFLISHPGWVYTRNQIVENIHGQNYPVTDRSIDVLIVGLRKKMGRKGELIDTVRGIGYKFKDE